MKKLLSLAAAFLLCAGVQAQIVSSRSVSIKSAQKQPSETQWFLRGGLNVMKMTGDGAEDTGSQLGYNFVYGFQQTTGRVGRNWGMAFGLGYSGNEMNGKFVAGNDFNYVHPSEEREVIRS